MEEVCIQRTTTPAYRAPEMWDLLNRQRVDTKVDIWVRGCGGDEDDDGGELTRAQRRVHAGAGRGAVHACCIVGTRHAHARMVVIRRRTHARTRSHAHAHAGAGRAAVRAAVRQAAVWQRHRQARRAVWELRGGRCNACLQCCIAFGGEVADKGALSSGCGHWRAEGRSWALTAWFCLLLCTGCSARPASRPCWRPWSRTCCRRTRRSGA